MPGLQKTSTEIQPAKTPKQCPISFEWKPQDSLLSENH